MIETFKSAINLNKGTMGKLLQSKDDENILQSNISKQLIKISR